MLFSVTFVHPNCNHLKTSDFNKLVESDDGLAWSCYKCTCMLFPFNSEAESFSSDRSENNSDHTTSSFSSQHKTQHLDFLESLNCKYYDAPSFNTMISNLNLSNKSSASFYHRHINSLNLHLDNLELFLESLNFNFNVIGLSETRILTSSPSSPMILQLKLIMGEHFFSSLTILNHIDVLILSQ